MAKSKKETKSKNRFQLLIRSDKNLLAFGLFGAALLIGVFLYFDYFDLSLPGKSVMANQGEHIYRVESAPASITDDNPTATGADNANAQSNQDDAVQDY